MDLRILADPEEVAREAASELARRAGQRAERGGRFALALSGGSTPRRLFRLLASPAWRDRLPWASIHLFWGDERAVPPDHPESNYGTARKELLERVPIPAGNVHPVIVQVGAAEAARRYEEELRVLMAPPPGRPPRFDLVLLGLGADGHTASLFPASCALEQRRRWVVAPWVEQVAGHRITLTLPVLNAAAAVAFLVTGSGKAEALARVLTGEGSVEEAPARGVRPTDGELLWLVDQAAAAALRAQGVGRP
jgi:6-phosphogluconolactonase